MTQSNIKVILVILSIAMLGGVYMYVFKTNMDDKASIEAECDTLEAKLADLRAKEVNRDMYVTETENYKKLFDDGLKLYPATLDQEIMVMFAKSTIKDEGDNKFDFSSFTLPEPTSFFTLTGFAGEDGTTAGYDCSAAQYSIGYSGSYDGVKNFIDYIMNYKYRMAVADINITYNSVEDIYTGSVNVNAYCINGEGRTPDTVSVSVEEGLDNIFMGGGGAAAAGAAVASSHDESNGDDIKTSNDIKILLNNANNDNSDGVIVSSGGSDTYVTSSDNDVARLQLSVFEEDGKKYAEYKIGEEEYKFEITGDELTIFVESSDRVDAEDKNGVRLTVDNATTIPVFVKVDGDDTTSPRFTLGSKTGTVKVY